MERQGPHPSLKLVLTAKGKGKSPGAEVLKKRYRRLTLDHEIFLGILQLT